jgi:methionine aminotransferase
MEISKLPNSDGSIFAKMGAVASKFSALNLSQGFPDFDPDIQLIDALQQAARSGINHQYAPSEGVLTLREAISAMMDDLYGFSVSPVENITITVGATQAIFTTVQALIHAGDEAVYFEPAFECYEPAIKLAGGVPVSLPLDPVSYLPDWDKVESSISARTKLIIINNPHNPSGSCWTLADMRRLGKIAEKHNLWVLSDEVYHNIVFSPYSHVAAWYVPELAERSIIVGSLGKTLHVTGWRLGYMLASRRLTLELRKLHQFSVYAAPTLLQHAVAAVLGKKESYSHLSELFQGKRDRFLSGLEGSRFKWVPSKGAYFQLLDYSEISNENDKTFAERLVKEHRIAAIPLSGFHSTPPSSRTVRFCFAKRNETLDRATAILREV